MKWLVINTIRTFTKLPVNILPMNCVIGNADIFIVYDPTLHYTCKKSFSQSS